MFPDSFDLRSVVEAQTVDSAWGGKLCVLLEYLGVNDGLMYKLNCREKVHTNY